MTLNFANAEIEAVARTMAAITGRNVVVDPRVQGSLNLVTEKPVLPDAAWNQFMTALRFQGIAVVHSDGVYKLVPEADAKLQGGSVGVGRVTGGGQLMTQIFRLNHESANNLVPILRPLISPNNTINVNPGNNSLVITDYADNLQRLGKIVAAMDMPNATSVEIIRLRHAVATELAPLVVRLIESGSSGAAVAPGGQPDASYRTALVAEPRSNALILRAANPARVALVRSLVERLDQPAQGGSGAAAGNIHVVFLKNADATRLAATLRAAMAADVRTALPGAAGQPGGGAAVGGGTAVAPVQGGASAATSGLSVNQPSTGGAIQADPSTNSLVISAPEPQYRQLRAVIDQLDGRRAQVFVESLIAEVNAEKAAEFGVQWQGPFGNKGDSHVGVLGTNFSVGGTNIISLALRAAMPTANAALPATGFNLGVAQKTGGNYVLGFLARFLQSNGDANILSTPNLMTLDNEEARIVIGQNVPFVTGQYTNNNSNSGAVNPFQTIERKDVGLTLRVKPQISENGTVKMQIFQEVSNIDRTSLSSASGLITNKRSIESSVLVEDGAIVVLGGLLQDEYNGNQEKVPGLGDVPLLGNLFKSETRSRRKTNLMVFLRPVVVRDASSTDSLSMDRYDLMRSHQSSVQPLPSLTTPVNESALMLPQPALPMPPSAATTPSATPAGPEARPRAAPPPLMPYSPVRPPTAAPLDNERAPTFGPTTGY